MSYFDSWGGILSKHTQLRCKICADGTGKAADLVCADAWETDEKGYPLFQELPGTSLIVARTAKGAELLEAAQAQGFLETAPYDPAGLAQIQPGQFGRRRALWARLAGLVCLGRPIPRYRGLNIARAARLAGIKVLLTNFLGIVRRGLQRRI